MFQDVFTRQTSDVLGDRDVPSQLECEYIDNGQTRDAIYFHGFGSTNWRGFLFHHQNKLPVNHLVCKDSLDNEFNWKNVLQKIPEVVDAYAHELHKRYKESDRELVIITESLGGFIATDVLRKLQTQNPKIYARVSNMILLAPLFPDAPIGESPSDTQIQQLPRMGNIPPLPSEKITIVYSSYDPIVGNHPKYLKETWGITSSFEYECPIYLSKISSFCHSMLDWLPSVNEFLAKDVLSEEKDKI